MAQKTQQKRIWEEENGTHILCHHSIDVLFISLIHSFSSNLNYLKLVRSAPICPNCLLILVLGKKQKKMGRLARKGWPNAAVNGWVSLSLSVAGSFVVKKLNGWESHWLTYVCWWNEWMKRSQNLVDLCWCERKQKPQRCVVDKEKDKVLVACS